ncbi:MAG: cupin domain-containing protein [Alphaproteobacteria bacterium]|nr:cupin domain-containing protein [Alphaproteobacteria bacterium]
MLIRIGAVLLAAAIAAGSLHAREDAPPPPSIVDTQELIATELAGEPDKEAVTHVYAFPAGAVLPWHIHPDAHEVVYILDGDFTMEVAGEEPKTYSTGESFYLAPNRVHRGMNRGSLPAKIFVVRIKPKTQPLTQEVAPPAE